MQLEKFRMWGAAEELMQEIERFLPRARKHSANSADHMERSGESLMFNMAEGIGAHRPKVKIAAYEIAKKEANEVRAVLRRYVVKRALTTAEIQRAYNLAGAVIGMLTSAITRISIRYKDWPLVRATEPTPRHKRVMLKHQ